MRTLRLLLNDMLDATAVVEKYLPADRPSFLADPPIQSHIIRHIAIIGEAASKLPKDFRDANTAIPWREIIAMRNIVVHVYHGINWDRVYDTAVNDVPVLKREVTTLIANLPPGT